MLPKIRMFLYKVISCAVAVAERLNSRGLNVETTCKLCNGGIKTINHVLLQCSITSETWREAWVEEHSNVENLTPEETLSYVFDAMEDNRKPQSVRRTIPWVLWLIWKNMNSIIYAATQDSIGRLLRDMSEEMEKRFILNNSPIQEAYSTTRVVNGNRWSPPENGVVKCNVHANWRNAYLHSGVAWITRDHEGNVFHYALDAITYAPTRLVAELRCVIWALRSLRDLGWTKVIIALDYQEVVEAITAPHMWPKLRSLLEQVRKPKEEFVSLVFEGEKISTNSIAREIAKSVLRDGRL